MFNAFGTAFATKPATDIEANLCSPSQAPHAAPVQRHARLTLHGNVYHQQVAQGLSVC